MGAWKVSKICSKNQYKTRVQSAENKKNGWSEQVQIAETKI